jgi:hypothetical protein
MDRLLALAGRSDIAKSSSDFWMKLSRDWKQLSVKPNRDPRRPRTGRAALESAYSSGRRHRLRVTSRLTQFCGAPASERPAV